MQMCRSYIYALLLGVILFNVLLAMMTRAVIAYDELFAMATIAAGIAPALWAIRRQKATGSALRLVAGVLETIVLIDLLTLAFRVFDHVTKTNQLPMADPLLAAADQALGFDWQAYFTWIHDTPILHGAMLQTYGLLEIAMLITIAALFLTGRRQRGALLIEAIVWCSLFSVSIGAFFPATGATIHYLAGDTLGDWPNFGFVPGVYHMETLTALRDPNQVFRIGEGAMVGLNTFPSMHTASAVLLIVFTWRTWLVGPALAFAVPMLMATPVWGGHYLVDILAGAAMALTVTTVLQRGARASFAMAETRAPDAIPAE